MINNENISQDFVNKLGAKIAKLFLYTTFINPLFLKGELAKHLELSDKDISLNEVGQELDNDIIIKRVFKLKVYECEYELIFDRRITEKRVIDVPRVVKNNVKWYQVGQPDTKVVIEKKEEKPIEYWVLSAIA